MKTVRRLLTAKDGGDVLTINPTTPASEALRVMAEHDIGALLIVDGERVVGIVTERDMVRKLAHPGHNLATTPVSTIMTDRVLYVEPSQTIEECMALMTDKHLRHLPVIDGGRLIGIVSIRDVVADLIAEKSFIIEQLEHYIYAIPPYGRQR